MSKKGTFSNSHIKDKRKISVVNYVKTYFYLDEYNDRGIEKEQQTPRIEKSRTAQFMTSTEPTWNRDTTQNKLLENKMMFTSPSGVSKKILKTAKISNGSMKLALFTRSSQSSKQGLDMSTHASKESVYGEQGCPDNPWREDLYDLLRTWVEISKQNNIEYVLACSSLLGAMRNGDIIPYGDMISLST